METFKDRQRTPFADMHAEIVAVNHAILSLRKEQMEEEIRTLDIQARVNRLQGALSDLTQRVELKNAQQTTERRTRSVA